MPLLGVERPTARSGRPRTPSTTSFIPYTDMGRTRLDHIEQCLDAVRHDDVPGDLVECGTGRGGGAIFMRAWLDAHEIDDRRVWVADHFRSSPEPGQGADPPVGRASPGSRPT
ncbi:MAG: TylF/MycF/NovP-related O-methyltransferase [Acidimicrobiales bacterium]|nr:TylF/MycF/NovP-related O-methyltransferase [Acidimicrobiales bacterium]